MQPGPHLDALEEAIAAEARGQRALLDGDDEAGTELMAEAAELYRRSWELAPPASYGRLIGMLKASLIAGGGEREAAYAREQMREQPGQSPPAGYVLAIAALVQDDDAAALVAANAMREGSPAFVRTADAVDALARRDRDAYTAALAAVLADFESRDRHLTGVPIADTALMLQRLAARRGLSAGIFSPLLPARV